MLRNRPFRTLFCATPRNKAGSVQLAKLSLHEKHVLGVIRQSSDYTPDLLLDAWRDYRARQRIRSSFTVTQLCRAYYAAIGSGMLFAR
jgi:hypothetical protein